MRRNASESSQTDRRIWLAAGFWGASIVLLVAVLWASIRIIGDARLVDSVLAGMDGVHCYEGSVEERVQHLGGPGVAINRLSLYLAIPAGWAPRRVEATTLLGGCGVGAVPRLRSLCSDDDSRVQAAAVAGLGQIGGPDAVDCLVWMLRNNNDSATQIRVRNALADAGPSAVAALVGCLEDRDAGVRWAGATALGKIGPPALAAAPALTKALRYPDRKACLFAAGALAEIGAPCDEAVVALLELVEPEDEYGFIDIAESLEAMGPRAHSAIPALKNIAQDPEFPSECQWAAEKAIAAIEGSVGAADR